MKGVSRNTSQGKYWIFWSLILLSFNSLNWHLKIWVLMPLIVIIKKVSKTVSWPHWWHVSWRAHSSEIFYRGTMLAETFLTVHHMLGSARITSRVPLLAECILLLSELICLFAKNHSSQFILKLKPLKSYFLCLSVDFIQVFGLFSNILEGGQLTCPKWKFQFWSSLGKWP